MPSKNEKKEGVRVVEETVTSIVIAPGLWSTGMCIFVSGVLLLRSPVCAELCFASLVGLVTALAGAEVHTQIIAALVAFACLDAVLFNTMRNVLRCLSRNRGRPHRRRPGKQSRGRRG